MGKIADRMFENRPGATDWKPTKHPIRWYQEKKDGYRLTFIREKDGEFVALGRTDNYWSLLSGLKLAEPVHDLPEESIIDGELYIPGHPASDVVTAMKNGWKSLKYDAFAVPYLAGECYEDEDLEEVNNILQIGGFTTIDPIRSFRNERPEELLYRLLTLAQLEKIEGYVVKNKHYAEWYKIKPEHTCDLVVMDFKEGEKKYTGMLGALICGAYNEKNELVELASVGGGFDDAQRSILWKPWRRAKLKGEVVEVMYQDVMAKGRLKYPRFLRFRDDKPAKECTLKQLGVKQYGT